MIPTFLQSLAATVRDLVRTGKAVHVTNATAAECELLAGLPWGECANVTPADLAFGWLLASRAMPQTEWVDHKRDVIGVERITDDGAKRAAEGAELALISVALLPRFEGTEPGVLQSHQGTREGARAAWSFVCTSLQLDNPVRDRYRRELEAM